MEIRYLILVLIVLTFASSVYACDWEVEIQSDKIFENESSFEFQFITTKEEGNKTNITLVRSIEDIYGNLVKIYDNLTYEITEKKTYPKLSPDLNSGTYVIKGQIFPDCNDTNLENNYIEKLIAIKEEEIGIANNNCDWKLKIFSDYTFENGEDVNWKVKVEKGYGGKTNISVRGYVKEYFDDWEMDYKPWTNESVLNYRNQEYSPNLDKDRIYEIFYNITELNCNDTDLNDNFVSKLIYIGEELPKECEECVKCKECKPCKSTKTECPLIVQSSNEKDIKDKVQENISYISKEVKERRYAIYFFCLLLICMLINYIVKKNG